MSTTVKKRIQPVTVSPSNVATSSFVFAQPSTANNSSSSYQKFEKLSKEDLIKIAMECEKVIENNSIGLRKYRQKINSNDFLNKYTAMDDLEKQIRKQNKQKMESRLLKEEKQRQRAIKISAKKEKKANKDALKKIKEMQKLSKKKAKEEKLKQLENSKRVKKAIKESKKHAKEQKRKALQFMAEEKKQQKLQKLHEKERTKKLKLMAKSMKKNKTVKKEKNLNKQYSKRCPRGTRRNEKTGNCEPRKIKN